MYQEYYGLKEMPFNITPDPKFLYLSPAHEEALSHLRYGIAERKGFIVLTGEVGCGKTTLCRTLLDEMDDERFETILILNPRISEQQLIAAILRELGEAVPKRSKADLTGRLNDALMERIEAGREIVMIVDEAQNLSFEVMEQIRLLSNLETDDQKLMQIILMGQPELKAKLQEKRLRQFRQRVLVYYDLSALTRVQTEAYIQHRLTLAGSNGRPRFTPWALRKIYKKTHGTPRLINNLCDKSLLAAYVRDSDNVTWWDVRKAVRDITRL
ncbi:ExeA family protein [Rubellicoccus peritrichatus]|uniref:AAA family ATPase n=1 Tax=Rubellicoccus peritrichatus TaxID=3080537 RepID=A0AAQ3QS59_9BACT|nr:AAA family ATPase [Puniceicoccus sp. CR14]WOO42053.1 AAA family ATPase [Puniceicoccus sp. CR14]